MALGPSADRAGSMAIIAATNGRQSPKATASRDVGAELQLVLDELRGEGEAVGELADILGAVDDDEMAVLVDKAGIAGPQPAFRR